MLVSRRKHNQTQGLRSVQEQILLFSRMPEGRLEQRAQNRVQRDPEENEEMNTHRIYFILL